MEKNTILQGDALTQLRTLESESVDCCITSPPYWALRDYKQEGQLGLEPTFTEYIAKLIEIFSEVKRVLKRSGSCWVNMGDTYNGNTTGNNNGSGKSGLTSPGRGKDIGIQDGKIFRAKNKQIPEKSLCLIPQRFAIAMVDQGWIMRNTIIWYKPNCMPSSAKDRFTVDFEYLFFFTKSQRYYFDTQYEPMDFAQVAYRKEIRAGKLYDSKEPYLQNSPYARMPKIGGNKAPGYENPTYSGNQPEIKEIIGERAKLRAMELGWNPNEKSYAEWYFEYRKQVRFTPNHDHDLDLGLSGQRRQDNKWGLTFPYGRIKRCVWQIPTQPFSDAHFAVFPEALIETPIKASCPEYICKKCGKPRERIVEPLLQRGTEEVRSKGNLKDTHNMTTLHEIRNYYRTMGYESSPHIEKGWIECNCNAGFDGGIVLDPFIGSGTVGVVAMQNARNFIGVELNQSYIDMALKRLNPYLKQERITSFATTSASADTSSGS